MADSSPAAAGETPAARASAAMIKQLEVSAVPASQPTCVVVESPNHDQLDLRAVATCSFGTHVVLRLPGAPGAAAPAFNVDHDINDMASKLPHLVCFENPRTTPSKYVAALLDHDFLPLIGIVGASTNSERTGPVDDHSIHTNTRDVQVRTWAVRGGSWLP